MEKLLLQAKFHLLQPLFIITHLQYPPLCTSGVMPQDPVWIWAQCRWNGLSKDTGFTRSSLCAPNETDFSNNISKAGESEAAMHTLSNYCCGPVIALPKSCFNNMKGWTAHAYREEGKTIIKSIGFLSKKSEQECSPTPWGRSWGY